MDLEEVKGLFTEYGDAFYKSLLFNIVVGSLPDRMLETVVSTTSVDSLLAGGYVVGAADRVVLREVRRKFQAWFVALLKTPASGAEVDTDEGPGKVRPSGSEGQVQCDDFSMEFHNLQVPEFAEKVAANVKEHLSDCKNCRARFELYKKMFPEGLDAHGWRYIEQIGGLLFSHFSLMGAEVDCRTARPFLPLLADEERAVLVDTPVTAHVDYCQDCRNDVELLRGLGLDSQQAERLAQLYSRPASEGSDDCERFSESIALIAKVQFDKVDKKALEHVRMCKRCRQTLRNERAATVYAVGRGESQEKGCHRAETGELFDHCVLFAGLDAKKRLNAEYKEVSAHVAGCRTCLEKIFRMHGVIFSAANRGESGIVSCYELPTETEREGFTNVSGYYSRVGMLVGVRDKSKDELKAAGLAQKTRRPAVGRRRRRLVPAAAAAIILMAVGLILLPLRANGRIALAEVYQAIAEIQNVCISRFGPGEDEPTRIQYFSKSLGIRLFNLEDRIVLRDLENMVIKIKDRATGEITTEPISPDKLIEFRESLAGTLGLVPFAAITDVPADAQWNDVRDEDLESVIPGTEVYELTWSETQGESAHYYKWRVLLDPRTALPHRTQFGRRVSGEYDYEWRYVYVVTYPSEGEIEGLIQEAFE
ncbi:MAG: hypothetical protein ACYTEL_15850 [Planctomycetota bacterium]